MEQRIGNLVVEVTRAATAKFTAPVLLVHGLWCTAAVWRRWAGFLGHHGWVCYALHLRGRGGTPPATALAEYEDDVGRMVAVLETPPVIIGHDLGGLLALRVAVTARAVVALAPRVPRPYSAAPARGLIRATTLPALLFGRAIGAPRGARGRAYWGDPLLPLVAEPAAMVRALWHETMPLTATTTPTLIVAGTRDPFVDVADAARLARAIGAALRLEPTAGHALPVEAGWDRRVSAVHRWLIQQLGDPVLALREESETE